MLAPGKSGTGLPRTSPDAEVRSVLGPTRWGGSHVDARAAAHAEERKVSVRDQAGYCFFSRAARQLSTTVTDPVPTRSGAMARNFWRSGIASNEMMSGGNVAICVGVPAENVAPVVTSTCHSARR